MIVAATPRDHPGGTAGQGEEDGLGEELDADMAFGRAQGAAQPDLRAAFQHGDDHDVGHADRADQQRDGAQAEEQDVEGALGVGLGDERGGGLGDVDLLGLLRVGLGGEQIVHLGGLAGDGAHVDRGRPPAVLQVGVRGGVADQHRGVDLRGEHRGLEDAHHVEPLRADPDPLPGPDLVDAHPLCGGGAEHRHRFLLGGGVEEYPVREGGADRGGQAQAGGVDAERVGVHGGDVGGAEGALVAHGADVLDVGHARA